MGIKELWSILTPFCERKPLFELEGKAVAVDLSCWICEAQKVTEHLIKPRMYLRNLYFRTCYLLLMDVQPVFVLEGKAPVLKHQTIANRNEIQFGAKPKTNKSKPGQDRSRFNMVLKKCEDMLNNLGLVCVKGNGEAESMCAYLNEEGLVAGCISQDSDCFAYGARVVFRNFSISHQGSYAASGGAVDIYDIQKANESLNFGRNKIIALALICGSDYNEGIHGVGKDSAIKFMNKYDDSEILDRMRSWRKNTSIFAELEQKMNDKNTCVSCGHFGKIQSHSKSGCAQCKTTKGCDFSKYKNERLEIKNELQIRSKALADPEFPSEALINEFLVKKDNVKELDLKWRQPNLINFVKFTTKNIEWEEIYAFKKMLPILTRWQIKNHKFVFDKIKRNSISEIKGIIFPKYIKKARNPKGVPSYEIIWEDRQKCFEHLIPEEQLEEYLSNNNDIESLWSTIEPKYLIDAAYPDLVADFLEKKDKKAKKPSKRPKKAKNSDELTELTDQLLNTSISEPKVKKSRGRPKKTKDPDPNINPAQTIDNYFPKTKVEQLKQQSKNELNFSFDLNASKFGDEDELNLDLSGIIDDIVSQSPKLPEKLKKAGYCVSLTERLVETKDNLNRSCFLETNHDQPHLFEDKSYLGLKTKDNLNRSCFLETNHDQIDLLEKSFEKLSENCETKDNLLNQSCFFETNYDQVDLFEKTFDKNSFMSDSSSETSENHIKTYLTDSDNSETFREQLNNTFDEKYVPLFDRIKNGRLNTVP